MPNVTEKSLQSTKFMYKTLMPSGK
uniref:Uncharacterized protein n=1 Tax=Anguilla anguilla TaxID=7936 RepID=A0A0E9V6C0_ANGAN